MQRYQVCDKLGDGTYGCVWKAKNRDNGETVAIKKLKKKYNSWDECLALRELESLQCLAGHRNIVKLKEVIRENDSQLQFVFEYMPEGSLYDLIKKYAANKILEQLNQLKTSNSVMTLKARSEISLPFTKVQSIMRQILSGLEYIHSSGFVHRDIKPENILLDGDKVKIADFGLSRNIRNCSQSDTSNLTAYVSTRWYRAPEVLLRAPSYSSSVDIFATGCVLAELVTCKPLFPGSSEIDQIYRIFDVLGNISFRNNQDFSNKRRKTSSKDINMKLFLSSIQTQKNVNIYPKSDADESTRSRLKNIVKVEMPFMISMLDSLLKLNPNDRITASAALMHSFFLADMNTKHRTTTSSLPQSTNESIQRNLFCTRQNHPRKRPLESIHENDANNQLYLSTGIDDTYDIKYLNDFNVNSISFSENSTPSIDSDRSEVPLGSPDILSCIDNMRSELLSSDSYMSNFDSAKNCQLSNTMEPFENFVISNQDQILCANYSSNCIDENISSSDYQLQQRKRSRCPGGFGRNKFR